MVNTLTMTLYGKFLKAKVVPMITRHQLCSLMVVSITMVIDNVLHVTLLLLGRLLYTSFRQCVIPPPMCSHVLTMPVTTTAINQVTFSPCLQYMLVMSSVRQVILYCLAQDGALIKDQHSFQPLTSCPKLLNSTR